MADPTLPIPPSLTLPALNARPCPLTITPGTPHAEAYDANQTATAIIEVIAGCMMGRRRAEFIAWSRWIVVPLDGRALWTARVALRDRRVADAVRLFAPSRYRGNALAGIVREVEEARALMGRVEEREMVG